jgi:hypothetical protein
MYPGKWCPLGFGSGEESLASVHRIGSFRDAFSPLFSAVRTGRGPETIPESRTKMSRAVETPRECDVRDRSVVTARVKQFSAAMIEPRLPDVIGQGDSFQFKSLMQIPLRAIQRNGEPFDAEFWVAEVTHDV